MILGRHTAFYEKWFIFLWEGEKAVFCQYGRLIALANAINSLVELTIQG